MIEVTLPKKYSLAESKVYKEGFLDGYTTGRKSVLDKISASGRARWAHVSLEDRMSHIRMLHKKRLEKRLKTGHWANEKVERNEKIYKLRESGLTFAQIGKEIGIHGQRARDIYYRLVAQKSGKGID